MFFLWSYKRSIGLSGGSYLSNWVCVWSQRRPGGLSAGAIVYGRSRLECTICLSGGGVRLRYTLVV